MSRILQVNKFLYRRGGAEGYMLDLADLQRSRGHEVEFFSMQHPENQAAPLDAHFPSEADFGIGAGPKEKLKAAGRMFWSIDAARGLRAAVSEFRPDVAHLHNIYHQLSPSILREFTRVGVPVVMTLHDYKLVCPSYQMLVDGQPCERCLDGRFRHAVQQRCNRGSLAASLLVAAESRVHHTLGAYDGVDAFVCPSRFLFDRMTEGGFGQDRLRHIPHFSVAVDGEPETDERRGVVFGGRLSHEKGVTTLIDAMAFAPDTTLDVAGDGELREELEAHASRVAPGRVRFLGRIDKDELHRRFRSARAVVVPSEWYENQPMVILEALSTGTPVVGTDIGGIPELIRDGIDGAVVPPGDAAALGAAIQRLESADVEAMGRAGAERVERDFAVDIHLDRLDALYAELS